MPAHCYLNFVHVADTKNWTWYYLYPDGQQGYCNASYDLQIDVEIKNDGDTAGYCYAKITRGDTGEVLLNQTVALAVNGVRQFLGILTKMPYTDLVLNFEIGHI